MNQVTLDTFQIHCKAQVLLSESKQLEGLPLFLLIFLLITLGQKHCWWMLMRDQGCLDCKDAILNSDGSMMMAPIL